MSEALQLSEAEVEHLRQSLIDHCLAHGLVVRPQPQVADNSDGCLSCHAPVALHPSPFPRHCFEHAVDIQAAYNELYARIASDTAFLKPILDDLAKVDDFTRQLWEMHLDIRAEAARPATRHQSVQLGLFRSDYLLHAPEGDVEHAEIKQVEFNTVSSSFAALATRTAGLHRAMLAQGNYGAAFEAQLQDLPVNGAMQGLAAGLAEAWKAYGVQDACILFVIQPGERNAFDQRWLEYILLEEHNIHAYRVTLADVLTRTSVGADGKLTLGGLHKPREVAVVYYRAGYGPDDYTTPEDWRGRRQLEASYAIKCPTLLTQLAGSKKVQQILTAEGVVERFLRDTQDAQKVRSTFVALYSLDDSPAGLEARKLAHEQPERFVLKPSREGGGNNIYRHDIPPHLAKVGEAQWPGYILMELLLPPVQSNAIVRAGKIYPAAVVSELGIYGACLWNDDGQLLYSTAAGHLLRTKAKETDEGGVAAGFACIDSPWLR